MCLALRCVSGTNHTRDNFDTIGVLKEADDALVIELLKQYFNIAFLMGKPQDLPAGENQMYTGIVLNLVSYILALIGLYSLGASALHATLDIAFTGVFLFLALMFTSRLPRFHQSFGAICGAGAILNFAAIPIFHLIVLPEGEAPDGLFIFSRVLVLAWSLSLVAHVLRHTFEMRMFTSIGVALLYYLFVSSVLSTIFPTPQASEAGGDVLSMMQFGADSVVGRILV